MNGAEVGLRWWKTRDVRWINRTRSGRRRRLSTQILTRQLTILVATVLVGFGLFAHQERGQLDRQAEQRATGIAATAAGTPEIGAALAGGGHPSPGGLVQTTAERIRRDSGASYVVVIGRDRVRWSHPDPALIGQRVAEPVVAADGKVHTGVDHGSLGVSANSRVPVYGPGGALVGEVSAGILQGQTSAALVTELLYFGLYFGLALGAAVLVSYLLARRLKRQTFGLELDEIASLVQEREAMLHGVREGMIALDRADRITLVNDEARRLLDLDGPVVGRTVEDVLPPGRTRDVVSGTLTGTDLTVVTDEYCLTLNRMPVALPGRPLGAVVTLRDRTELSGLLRELNSVQGLTNALRAQHHEFANRLHTLAGLLELGCYDEAIGYLTDLRGSHGALTDSIRDRVANPLVIGLLLGKSTVAQERGIDLIITEDSLLDERTPREKALVTILGNLIDNAMDAAAAGPDHPAVTVHIRADDERVAVTVSDTGPGIPPGSADKVFTDGFTTKGARVADKAARVADRRGLGLALVHRLVQRLGGTISVTEGPGAVFTVVLPNGDAGRKTDAAADNAADTDAATDTTAGTAGTGTIAAQTPGDVESAGAPR